MTSVMPFLKHEAVAQESVLGRGDSAEGQSLFAGSAVGSQHKLARPQSVAIVCANCATSTATTRCHEPGSVLGDGA